MKGALAGVFLVYAVVIGAVLGGRVPRSHKLALKTFKTNDGDIVDCVDFYKQPSLIHSSKEGHMISHSTIGNNETRKNPVLLQQTMSMTMTMGESISGSCPPGTIPIRRGPKVAPRATDDIYLLATVERALAHTTGRGPFSGARGMVTDWSINVENNEYSMSYISAIRASYQSPSGSSFDQYAFSDMVSVGWIVMHEVFGDNIPRLFVRWSNDYGRTTGCFNLDCPGFVQTNPHHLLGARLKDVSVYNDTGLEYGVQLALYTDLNLPRWYVAVGDQELGYWPIEELFPDFWKADVIVWGGEVLNTWPGGVHTTTQMGSGHFSSEGDGKASFFCRIQVRSGLTYVKYKPSYYQDQPRCYDTKEYMDDSDGYWFFYGGPGGQSCATRVV